MNIIIGLVFKKGEIISMVAILAGFKESTISCMSCDVFVGLMSPSPEQLRNRNQL
jgi:tRNA(Phe) wybutosine-synthesizing methylase Tyw3|tara:strand:- start:522 stop:686 length:165 start_codon:yes stop_codon:yes gene_type:complete